MNRMVGIFGVIALVLLLGASIGPARDSGRSLVAPSAPALLGGALR